MKNQRIQHDSRLGKTSIHHPFYLHLSQTKWIHNISIPFHYLPSFACLNRAPARYPYMYTILYKRFLYIMCLKPCSLEIVLNKNAAKILLQYFFSFFLVPLIRCYSTSHRHAEGETFVACLLIPLSFCLHAMPRFMLENWTFCGATCWFQRWNKICITHTYTLIYSHRIIKRKCTERYITFICTNVAQYR